VTGVEPLVEIGLRRCTDRCKPRPSQTSRWDASATRRGSTSARSGDSLRHRRDPAVDDGEEIEGPARGARLPGPAAPVAADAPAHLGWTASGRLTLKRPRHEVPDKPVDNSSVPIRSVTQPTRSRHCAHGVSCVVTSFGRPAPAVPRATTVPAGCRHGLLGRTVDKLRRTYKPFGPVLSDSINDHCARSSAPRASVRLHRRPRQKGGKKLGGRRGAPRTAAVAVGTRDGAQRGGDLGA